ncbi:MAG: DUF2283 domain-containing protein [Phycisphaerales bacterium]|nr:DUF2283 domain-containing protein [Phycisphaerales bacterium]
MDRDAATAINVHLLEERDVEAKVRNREGAVVIVSAEQSHYDATRDVLYLVAAGGPIHRSTEVAPGITLEYGKDGEVVGLEILRASQVLAEKVVAS